MIFTADTEITEDCRERYGFLFLRVLCVSVVNRMGEKFEVAV